MKKLAFLAAMIFALSMSATAMPSQVPGDDNLTQLSKDTKAKTEAMKKYNDALKDEVKASKDLEKAQKKIADADKEVEKAKQKVKDAENKVKDAEKKAENARKDYENNADKLNKAKQKTIETKKVIDQMDGIIVNDGYNR